MNQREMRDTRPKMALHLDVPNIDLAKAYSHLPSPRHTYSRYHLQLVIGNLHQPVSNMVLHVDQLLVVFNAKIVNSRFAAPGLNAKVEGHVNPHPSLKDACAPS